MPQKKGGQSSGQPASVSRWEEEVVFGGSMNVEVYSGGGLKAFHLAVKLTDKWLTKKAPSHGVW